MILIRKDLTELIKRTINLRNLGYLEELNPLKRQTRVETEEKTICVVWRH